MISIKRKANFFEKVLLPIAFIVGIVGFYMLYTAQKTGQWLQIIAVFSWLILIFMMILAATNEDVKEEIGLIIREQVDEIKIIKELNHDLLAEMKLLREDMKRK